MAKVIIIDNFDRDYISDRLFKDNLTMEEAEKLATEENSKTRDNTPDYYKAVEDDYTLHNAYENLP